MPPEPITPHGASPRARAASPCSMSSVIAMISASKRVWLGHMSRCSAFTYEKWPKDSAMRS